MKTFLILILVVLSVNLTNLFSQSMGKKETVSYIFVNSYPIRAKVLINGRDNNILTPCILRNLSSDTKVGIKKDGYNEYTLSAQDIISKKFDINLVPNSFDIYFPERTSYKLGNTDTKGPVYVSKLKSGQYDINITDNKIVFRKTSLFLPAYVGVGTALGISLLSTGSLIGVSEYYNYNANEARKNGDATNKYHYETMTRDMDYVKIPSIALSGLLFTGLLSLIIADAVLQYNDKRAKLEILDKSPSNQDEIFYDTALQYLSSGDIKRSTDILLSIISIYPESDLIPKVFYQLGQNYFIMQEYDTALKNWEIFLRDYPIADYYDYVLKNMADIYYEKKELLMARNQLDKIIFTENILNRESILSLRAKISYDLYLKEQTDQTYISSETDYLKLIDDFKASERVEVYFIQLLKLYNYKGDTDKITKLKEKASKLEVVNEKVREIILSYFN